MCTPLINVLGQIHIFERDMHREQSDPRKKKFLNIYFGLMISLSIVAVIFVIIGYLRQSDNIKITALLCLITAYLMLFLMPIFSTWLYRSSIKQFRQNTLVPQLNNTRIAITASNHFLPILTKYSKSELELTASELKTERDALEKRVGLIVGAIDKIGLGPGLIAALGAILKLQGDIKGFGAADWLMGAAYGVLGLYLIGAFAHMSILRVDRALKLLELAISKKKSHKIGNLNH